MRQITADAGMVKRFFVYTIYAMETNSAQTDFRICRAYKYIAAERR